VSTKLRKKNKQQRKNFEEKLAQGTEQLQSRGSWKLLRKEKKNYEEKILIISEKLKSKDDKTTRQSLTNAMLQKEKAERAIEKLREEQIDIQYSH
jgi:hypothetical protein